jgi:hypothetical protein
LSTYWIIVTDFCFSALGHTNDKNHDLIPCVLLEVFENYSVVSNENSASGESEECTIENLCLNFEIFETQEPALSSRSLLSKELVS